MNYLRRINMKLFLGDKCWDKLFELPKSVQYKVRDFQRKFTENPYSPAINLEKINTFKDDNLRTARIDDTYRAIIGVASDGDFVRMKDGRVILRKGMLYKVAENTVELMSANYADASDLTIIEYVDPDNITLSYVLTPENTADNVVRYYCEDPNVTIDADGNVRFAVLDERAVRIIARTENGVAAVVVLKWNKPQEAIPMS